MLISLQVIIKNTDIPQATEIRTINKSESNKVIMIVATIICLVTRNTSRRSSLHNTNNTPDKKANCMKQPKMDGLGKMLFNMANLDDSHVIALYSIHAALTWYSTTNAVNSIHPMC